MAFIWAKNELGDGYIKWLEPIYEKPLAIFSIFLASEIMIGIIPPELFMIWASRNGIVSDYVANVMLLAIISYLSGMIGHWIGSYLNQSKFYRLMKRNFFGKYERYINDFGILNTWGAGGNRDQYFNTIQYLLDEGAPLDGIGFQGHFSASDLTGPEELWQVIDQFDQLGLAMQVTEFDVNTTDEELQAAYTRDFITAMFAHEGIDDLILWGFWEDAHWRPDAALFRSDWSIKPNGQAFLDLVFGEWWTEEQSDTDANGEVGIRGFKGNYDVSATLGPHAQQITASLSDGGTSLLVELPFLQGDYNGDGEVNAADYTLWRDTQGSTTDLAADGNFDGVVDGLDYQLWRDRFGASISAPLTAVPEPTSFALIAILALAFMAFNSRQKPSSGSGFFHLAK